MKTRGAKNAEYLDDFLFIAFLFGDFADSKKVKRCHEIAPAAGRPGRFPDSLFHVVEFDQSDTGAAVLAGDSCGVLTRSQQGDEDP